MPPAEFSFSEIEKPGHEAGQLGHARLETQLTSHADVSQAHQFFQPRADAGLPNLTLQSDGGASVAAHKAVMAGGEQAITHIAGGVGHAAIAGSQQISPLVQMIMKLPGLTGVMNSFFEFLGALFHGNLLDALNPADWLQHAEEAMASMAHNIEHLASSIDLIHSSTPVLHFDGSMFHPGTQGMGPMQLHSELLDGKAAAAADAGNVGAPVSDVDLSQAVFEKTSNYTISEYHQNSLLDWHKPQNIALGGDSVYKPTMGGYYQNAAPTTTTAQPTAASAQASQPAAHTPAHHPHVAHHARHFKTRDVSLTNDHTQIAQASDATGGQYTIEHGDSLWDIARKQLGDGSRWGDIYKMNADVIGQNPDLIHPGTVLKMPDANSIAASGGEAGKYVVQPGDNLWNIARHHLGGGQHWGEIYKANADVIGTNPSLIRPGQELTLGGDGTAVASAPPADAAPVAAAPSSTDALPVASAPSSPMPVAHAAPSASEMASANGDLGEPNPAFASQPTAGMLKAEAPILAPTGAMPASAQPAAAAAATLPQTSHFANSVGVGGEQVIDSSTQVPAEGP